MSSTSQFTCALFEFLQQNDAIQKILFDKCGLHCQCIFLARWQTHYCYPCFEFQQQVDSCFHTETQRPHSTFQLVSSLPFTHKYLGWGVSFLGLAPCPPLQLTLSSVQIRLQIQMNTHKQKHLRKTKIKKNTYKCHCLGWSGSLIGQLGSLCLSLSFVQRAMCWKTTLLRVTNS